MAEDTFLKQTPASSRAEAYRSAFELLSQVNLRGQRLFGKIPSSSTTATSTDSPSNDMPWDLITSKELPAIIFRLENPDPVCPISFELTCEDHKENIVTMKKVSSKLCTRKKELLLRVCPSALTKVSIWDCYPLSVYWLPICDPDGPSAKMDYSNKCGTLFVYVNDCSYTDGLSLLPADKDQEQHDREKRTFLNGASYVASKKPFVKKLKSLLRVKRGLFNVIGTVSRSLFGTARDSDVDSLKQQVKALNDSATEAVMAEQHMLLYLNKTKTLENTLKKELSEFSGRVTRLLASTKDEFKKFSEQTRSLSVRLRLSELAQLAHLCIQRHSKMLKIWENAFLSAQNGLLHTDLVGPDVLLQYLERIEANVPRGMQLLIPKDTVFPYYQKKFTSVVLIENRLYYHIVVPLVRSDDRYHISAFKSIPIFLQANSLVATIHPPNERTFLLHNERGLYAELTAEELEECSPPPFRHCDENLILYKPSKPSCLTALYNRKSDEVRRLCQRKVSKLQQNRMFKFSNDHWFFSIQEDVDVEIKCNHQRRTMMSGAGNYVCNVDPGCEIIGNSFFIDKTLVSSTSIISQPNISIPRDIVFFSDEDLSAFKLHDSSSQNGPQPSEFNITTNLHATLEEMGKIEAPIADIKYHMERSRLFLKPQQWESFLSSEHTWGNVFLSVIIFFILHASYYVLRALYQRGSGLRRRTFTRSRDERVELTPLGTQDPMTGDLRPHSPPGMLHF